MSTPVVTVASGGLAIVEVAAGGFGMPVSEATNGFGIAVTKVVGKPGMPVVFDTIGVAPPVTYATFNPASVAAVTLSGGNLVATNTGTTASEQGAKSATAKTTGKYYFEMTFTAYSGSVLRIGAGVGPPASSYANMSGGLMLGTIIIANGVVNSNGASAVVDIIAGSLPVGAVVGIAIDLDNRKGWFRHIPSGGLWNGSATANPATNTEGVTVPAGTMVPYCTFGGTAGVAGNITTANFGASPFVGAVPSGFTSGWPA